MATHTREKVEAPHSGGSGASGELVKYVARFGVVVAFLFTIAIFGVLRPHVFLTFANLRAILQQVAPALILACGATVVLVMGDFDISFPNTVGLASATVITLMAWLSWGVVPAIAAGVAVGLVVGAVNGFLVAFLGGSSFIITLAVGQAATGSELQISKNQTIFSNIPHSYGKIAGGHFFNVSYEFYVAIAVFIVLYVMLERTEIGRFMYAIGGNREAARLSGINIKRIRLYGFLIVGASAAIAAVLLTSQEDVYSPGIGTPYLLPAYAAVFLGAAVFSPGKFNLLGTLVGSMFLEVLATGLAILNYSIAIVYVVQGAVLACAVLLSRLSRSAA